MHRNVRRLGTLLSSTGWRDVTIVLALSFVVAEIIIVRWEGGVEPPSAVDLLFVVYGLAGLIGALRLGWHSYLDRRTRCAWRIIAASYVLLSASQALRPLFPGALQFPTPADALRLAFVPLLLAGMLILPLRRQGTAERQTLIFDTAAVVVGSATLLWYLEIGPSLEAAGRIPGRVLAASIAYPALDLILVSGACLVLFRGAARSSHWSGVVLGAAMVTMVAGDAYLGYRQSHGLIGYDRWQLCCWFTGAFLLAVAPAIQCQQARRHQLLTDSQAAHRVSTTPYIAVGTCYVLLLLAARGQNIRVIGIIIGALVMTAVVVGRQIVGLRQNYKLATTDPLTGLVNRRQLYHHLRLTLDRSARNCQTVAVFLVDMNGFKQVNDNLGHETGDQVLAAFSQILRRNVLGRDIVARLGGDEFAIILQDIKTHGNAVAVAERIIEDMACPLAVGNDLLLQASASIGIALAAPGQLNADQALGHADAAMYAAKRAKTTAFAFYDASRITTR